MAFWPFIQGRNEASMQVEDCQRIEKALPPTFLPHQRQPTSLKLENLQQQSIQTFSPAKAVTSHGTVEAIVLLSFTAIS